MGIVGVGEEEQFGVPARPFQQIVHIGRNPIFRRRDQRRPHAPGIDGVHGKRVSGKQHLVADPGVSPAEEGDQIVRSGANDDPLHIDAILVGERGTQFL